MKPIHRFNVAPALPAPLERLRALAHNLRWSWSHDTIALFRRLDTDLWEQTGHNPVLLLGASDQAVLDAAAADDAFLAHLTRVGQDLEAYQAGAATWFRRIHAPLAPVPGAGPLIAYFSAEFGLTECLSIFAGGLGLLAGDHLKSASDLGVPLVGVGLLYQQGYFCQQLNEAGWQQEIDEDNDFHNLPLSLALGPDGAPARVEVDYPGRRVSAQVWRAQVGRVALYLLDTNIPANSLEDRDITDQLYGGDLEMRIKQEIMLGIGGYRALEVLGLEPLVYHMNEGHAAFLALERIRRMMAGSGLSFAEVREAASAGIIFTTHTPVAAGQDYFSPELLDRYFADYAADLGLGCQELLALGRQNPADEREPFCMTVLALRLAAHSNGVSRLHGQVTRRMWQGLWPGLPADEIPIGHVTNGVHLRSWISHEMDQLYERYLGPSWREEPADEAVWRRIERVPAEELWRTHELRRERLVSFARHRLQAQLARRGAPQAEIDQAGEALDSAALTIGFARRFATYKRATLLLRDPDRLLGILNNPDRPVQLIFAGKAHPRDDAGKALIQQIREFARRYGLTHRLVFLEDYDMAVARALVQGADLWLNTPLRPLEASGTSGMKAAANGVLNLSTLDGWWDEAWRATDVSTNPIGWAIGRGESYADPGEQERVEAEALYELLEQDVVPGFYTRDANGLPRGWIARMKADIGTLVPYFNTHRMVREYTERFYLPAAARYQQLAADGLAGARALAVWKASVQQSWAQVGIEAMESAGRADLQVGDELQVQAQARLGPLRPEDVTVELYLGRVDAAGEITEAQAVPMRAVGPESEGSYRYEVVTAPCRQSGQHGYAIRALPRHPALVTPFLPGLITWAQEAGRAR